MSLAPLVFGLGLALVSAEPTSTSSAAEAPLAVGVLAIGGTAREPLRREATRVLIDALRGFASLRAVALSDVTTILGAEANAALRACADDACSARVLAGVGVSRLVVGELHPSGPGAVVTLRLVDAAPPAAERARATREIGAPVEERLTAALIAAAVDLFPERAARSFGTLIVETGPSGAGIWLDGAPLGTAPLPPQSVKAGPHLLEVKAPGHRSERLTVEVSLGQRTSVTVDLHRNRSNWPFALGGAAVALGVAATVVGLVAKSTADDWASHCVAGTGCDPGYTRQRYDDETAQLGIQRNMTNVLWVGAAMLAVAAGGYAFFDPGSESP